MVSNKRACGFSGFSRLDLQPEPRDSLAFSPAAPAVCGATVLSAGKSVEGGGSKAPGPVTPKYEACYHHMKPVTTTSALVLAVRRTPQSTPPNGGHMVPSVEQNITGGGPTLSGCKCVCGTGTSPVPVSRTRGVGPQRGAARGSAAHKHRLLTRWDADIGVASVPKPSYAAAGPHSQIRRRITRNVPKMSPGTRMKLY